jgi:hypothetical protein
MACQIYRDDDGKIERVLAPNLQPSKLYPEILKEVRKQGADSFIKKKPYLSKMLEDGLLLDTTTEEIALGLWSMYYTPKVYKAVESLSYFDDPANPMSKDENGEPRIGWYINSVMNQDALDNDSEPSVLTDTEMGQVNHETAHGNKLQRQIIDEIFVRPENPVIMDKDTHTYYDQNGEVLASTTTKIKGVLDDDGKYEQNREWGNSIDQMLDLIIKDRPYEECVEGITNLDDSILRSLYNMFRLKVDSWKENGAVVLSQVIVADSESKTAGTIDIVVINPNGTIRVVDLKTSKNSVRSDKYDIPYVITAKGGPDTVQSVFIGQQLSTRQQHGIQIGTYAKMLQLKGFVIEGTETLHFKLELNNTKVEGVTYEGRTIHPMRSNREMIDKVVPTKVSSKNRLNEIKKELGIDNPANDPEFLGDSSKVEHELSGDMFDRMIEQVGQLENLLKKRKEFLDKVSKNKTFEDKAEAVDKINQLLILMGEELRNDSPSLAYGKFLNYAKAEITHYLTRISDPKEKEKENYITMLIEMRKYVESYRGIMKIKNRGSKEQQRMHDDVSDLVNDLFQAVQFNLENHVKNLVVTNTSRNLTEEDLSNILRQVYDIDSMDYWAGDLATSTDTLLAIVDKVYKQARNKVADRTDAMIDKLNELGNALLKASGKSKVDPQFYDFMKVFNKNGEWTTRFVDRIGQQYWDKYYAIRNKMVDTNGETKKYIEIPDLDTANPEHVKYNLELFDLKQEQGKFKSAEELTASGAEDGMYHKYTDEFKNARKKVMELIASQDDDGKITYRWQRKEMITDEAYQKYLLKYNIEYTYYGAVYDEGVFKGQVTQRTGWFPKSDYVEVRDIAKDGTDLRDAKWRTLNNPQTALEKAQSEFYNEFMKIKRQLDEKLPPEVEAQMRGKAGRVRAGFMDTLQKKGSGMLKMVSNSMRNYFSADLRSDQRLVDETGDIDRGIPILYVGTLQSEYLVSKIKDKILENQTSFTSGKITKKDYLTKKKELDTQLRYEESRIKASEVEGDLVKNMIAYAGMVENYDMMSSIEGDLKAIQEIVESRSYIRTDLGGRPLIEKGSRQTKDDAGKFIIKDSNDVMATKRLNKWFSMVFYNNDEFNRTQLAVIAKRIQNLASLKGVGFNVFGGINNYIMARINNAIETVGAQYYEHDAMMKAMSLYNTDYLPSVFTGLGKPNGEYYHVKEPKSKYEALVEHFRMVTKYQADSGKVDVMSWAYLMQEGGEYNAQSKVGMAILLSKEVKNTKTGDSVSIYDAYDFNPNNGKLTLKEGFELSDKDRYDTVNYIKEVNKQIHGNYAFEDRMVIQSHWLGQLGAQFHKWVYPAYKARFKKAYFDENLGVLEGRYRTLWNFLGFMKQSEGNLYEMMHGGWDDLSDVQRKNVMKVAAELAFLAASYAMYGMFKALGEGVDDEDENLKKWVNFMSYQGSRQVNEITTMMPVVGWEEQYQLLKSPIAILGTMKNFSEAVKSTMSIPFPPYDKNYYERGVHKGDLKAWKEWKDVIPALAIMNKWDSYESVKSFYIK